MVTILAFLGGRKPQMPLPKIITSVSGHLASLIASSHERIQSKPLSVMGKRFEVNDQNHLVMNALQIFRDSI